jgi:hypothetical protein
MKRFLFAVAVAAVAVTTPALATDVGLSISIGQPGFYGRLDIGGYPPPQVIYAQPIVVERAPVSRPPVYLRVPPGHAKDWHKHCREYNACGEQVFFVQDNWYNKEYVPRYKEKHRGRGGDRHDDDRGKGRGRGRDH